MRRAQERSLSPLGVQPVFKPSQSLPFDQTASTTLLKPPLPPPPVRRPEPQLLQPGYEARGGWLVGAMVRLTTERFTLGGSWVNENNSMVVLLCKLTIYSVFVELRDGTGTGY